MMKNLVSIGFSAFLFLMSAAASWAGVPPVWSADSARVTRDMRTRSYIAPSRVLWKSSSDPSVISGEDFLLQPGDGQAVLGGGNVCRMTARGDSGAAILLDFGRELQGGIRIVTGQHPSGKPVKVRVRFGESASEAMCEMDGVNGACNDHAIRFTATRKRLSTPLMQQIGGKVPQMTIDRPGQAVETTVPPANPVAAHKSSDETASS